MGIVTENASSQDRGEEKGKRKISSLLCAVSCFPCLYFCQKRQHSFHPRSNWGSEGCIHVLQDVGKGWRQQCSVPQGSGGQQGARARLQQPLNCCRIYSASNNSDLLQGLRALHCRVIRSSLIVAGSSKVQFSAG